MNSNLPNYNCLVQEHYISYSSYGQFTVNRASNRGGDNAEPSDSFVDVGTDFYAYIINTKIWKHLTYESDSEVVIKTETATPNQIWLFNRLEDGSYKITSRRDGKSLDLWGYNAEPGAELHLYEYHGGTNQRWYIYGSSGAYRFRAQCTQCYLDVKGGAMQNGQKAPDGTKVQMHTDNSSDDQLFSIWKLEFPTIAPPQLAVNVSGSDVKFTWNQVDNANRYDLEIHQDKGTNLADNDPMYEKKYFTSTDYTANNLPAGKYWAWVAGYNNMFGNWNFGNKVSFTVQEAQRYNLDLNGFLDGGNHAWLTSSAKNYGTVDVYINGNLEADDVPDYCAAWPAGTSYEIKDIKASSGCSYRGVKSGSLSGMIGNSDTEVRLTFATTYTVSYNANGGSGTPTNQTKYHSESLTLSSTCPTHPSYSFAGRSTSKDGEVEYQPGGTYSTDKNVTLYAVWSQNKYFLDVNGYLDGKNVNNINGYGTVDVYINGSLSATNQWDYYQEFAEGTKYEIKNIKEAEGCLVTYSNDGFAKEGHLSGTISKDSVNMNGNRVNVRLNFLSHADYGAEFYAHILSYYSKLYLTNDDDADVRLHSATGGANQIWHFIRDTDGSYKITSAKDSRCLDVYDGKKASGTNVRADSNDNGGAAQRWWIFGTPNDCQLRAKCTECLLGSETPSSQDGESVKVWEKELTLAQYFIIQTVEFSAYTVSFNDNGGSGSPSSQTKYHGQDLTLSSIRPTRSGYNFAGWATSQDGRAQYQPGSVYADNRSITLYAVWESIPVTPTADAYAILYDDGTFVFQLSNSPESGKSVVSTFQSTFLDTLIGPQSHGAIITTVTLLCELTLLM